MSTSAVTFEQVLEAVLRQILDERLRPLEEAVRRLRPEEEVLSVEGMAALLGWSVRTVRIKAKAGTIPAFKPPGSREWRGHRAELIAWQRQESGLDVEDESRKIVASLRGR